MTINVFVVTPVVSLAYQDYDVDNKVLYLESIPLTFAPSMDVI